MDDRTASFGGKRIVTAGDLPEKTSPIYLNKNAWLV
jgi:hypothetical protein